MSQNNQDQGNQQRTTEFNPNAAPFVPRQQQHVPVPLQLLTWSPQQLNPFHMEQSNKTMQFPQQNVGPLNAPPNQFSNLAQINSGLVIPGMML